VAAARFGEVGGVALSRELAYLGRHAWVSFKATAGLSRRTDQTFYVDRFVRALQAGTLPRTYGVLATGKNDGAGSQAQAAMSAICLAEAFGLTYVHRPFTVIEHTEGGMSDWIRQWEDYFNLGCGACQLSQCSSPVVPLDELLMAPEKWPATAIVAAPHYLRFCNQDPQGWERALPRLRTKFRQNKQPQSRDAFTIALHVRRGDVTTDDKKHAGRFTPNTAFIRTLESIMSAVSTDVSGDVRIKLFSQGDPAIFADFARAGCELHLDDSAIATHRQLVDADVLVMSISAFSYTAGVLNEGITLYDPHKYRPHQDWIVRAPDGSFDKKQFSRQLDSLLARKKS
jgi:hypothetical protein